MEKFEGDRNRRKQIREKTKKKLTEFDRAQSELRSTGSNLVRAGVEVTEQKSQWKRVAGGKRDGNTNWTL